MFKLAFLVKKNEDKKHQSIIFKFIKVKNRIVYNALVVSINLLFFALLLKFLHSFIVNIHLECLIIAIISTLPFFQSALENKNIFLKKYRIAALAQNYPNPQKLVLKFYFIDILINLYRCLLNTIVSCIYFFTKGELGLFFTNIGIILLVECILYSLNKTGHTSQSLRIFKAILGRGCLFFATYFISSFFISILYLLKNELKTNGYSFQMIQNLNVSLLELFHPVTSFLYRMNQFQTAYKSLIIGGLLLLCMVAFFHLDCSLEDGQGVIVPCSGRFFKKNGIDKNYFLFSDVSSILKKLSTIETFSLYLTGELCISIGLLYSIGTSKKIVNHWIILSISIFLIIFITRGTISTIRYNFRDWLKFRNELKSVDFFKVYDVNFAYLTQSKLTITRLLCNYFLMIQLLLFLFGYALIIKDVFTVLCLALLSFIIYTCRDFFIKYACLTDTIVFKMIVKMERSYETHEELSKFSGYRIISASNAMFVKLTTQLNTYVMLILGTTSIIYGREWLFYAILEFMILMIPIYIGSSKIGDMRDATSRI